MKKNAATSDFQVKERELEQINQRDEQTWGEAYRNSAERGIFYCFLELLFFPSWQYPVNVVSVTIVTFVCLSYVPAT